MGNDLKSLQRKAAQLLILDTSGPNSWLCPRIFQRAKPIVMQNICICAIFVLSLFFKLFWTKRLEKKVGSGFRVGECITPV